MTDSTSPDPLFSISDRVTIVSGGSRGIGKEMAAGFARRGAPVVVTGRNVETLDATVAEISGETDGPVRGVVCDVAQPDDISRLVEQVIAEFGRIDVLLNVAGVNRRKRVEAVTEEDYDFILDINLKGAFLVAQAVGKQMIAQESGTIINVDSLNTYAPLKGVAPYAMSKAGLVMMTRSLATEWGEHGVRVNTIAPGFILTDLTRKLWSDPVMQEWGLGNTPLGRLGEVEDLVGAAVFLAADASAFMTGQVVRVDGGFTSGLLWPIPLDD
ncbi:MAG: glucose 1-dehydrogenase [Planctomycetota bacterium]|nr:glucose 1-dehydrogenase [Planctomycetota bacterium]MED5401654.1 glucose 1-dehydrogenase [Planctomycetota bacterium]